MKYKIYKKIKNYIFLIEEGQAGFLLLDTKEEKIYNADCSSLDEIKEVENIILNNYDWSNCPENLQENLMTFEKFKEYEVLEYTKKENKYKINKIRNQYYLGIGLELDPILLVSSITNKRTSFQINDNIYKSSLTGNKYKLELIMDEDPTYEYKITNLESQEEFTYWMATAKCYYCFYDVVKQKIGEEPQYYTEEELVDFAGLEYIVYKKLYDTKYTDDRIFKETKEDLKAYLEKHKNFLLD